MAQQIINTGSAPNDNTGDPLRTAFGKVNDNFTELYGTRAVADGGTGATTAADARTNLELQNADILARTFVPTGGTARTLRGKIEDIVSVDDFGAVGDGTTDDLTAIQAAIDSLGAAGGVVIASPVTYKMTGTLRVRDYVTFDLRGGSLKLGSTTSGVVLETGAFVANGTITASGVTSYVGPAVLVSDSEGYSRLPGAEFGLDAVRIVGPGAGASASGTGVKLHGQSGSAGYGVTKGRFWRVSISNFSKGIHLYSEVSWVNDHRFYGLSIYGCVDFIYLQKGAMEVSGNYFEGLIQPNTDTAIASRALYFDGASNVFDGHIWDWNASGSTFAVEFPSTANQNVVRAMLDPRYVIDRCLDDQTRSFVTLWSSAYRPLLAGVLPPATSESASFVGIDEH